MTPLSHPHSLWHPRPHPRLQHPSRSQGTLGNETRNAFRGPTYFNTDLSLLKNLRLPWYAGREATVQLRFEVYNLFNRAHLANPDGTTNSPTFGQVTWLRGDPRVFQLGAKFLF